MTTISAIIFGGLSVLLVNANKTSRIAGDLRILQGNARYAFEQLSRDIRLAGYYGCVEDPNPTDKSGPIINKATNFPLSSNVLQGHDYPTNNQPATSIRTTENSDAIFVQYASEHTSLSTPTLDPLDDLVVQDVSGLTEGEIVMVATCEAADIFVISKIIGDHIQHQMGASNNYEFSVDNSSDSLSAIYPAGSKIYKIATVGYYVNTVNNSPMLIRSTNGDSEQTPWIPGVKAFQIQYWVDTGTDGIPDSYVNAGSITNWSTVNAIKLGLLMETEREYGLDTDRNTDTGSITILDVTIADDGRRVRRRQFETTIYVRNSR